MRGKSGAVWILAIAVVCSCGADEQTLVRSPSPSVAEDDHPRQAQRALHRQSENGPAGRGRLQHVLTEQSPTAERAQGNPVWLPTLIAVYCVVIVLASLGGGWLPSFLRLTHTRMQLMISLVGGLMLGVGVFHMLPHAFAQIGSIDRTVWWMMMGMLVMFFLLRVFHFHQHEHQHDSVDISDSAAVHDHAHEQKSMPAHPHRDHKLSWIGVAFGLSLHTLIDGAALAASVQAEGRHAPGLALLGLGTFLAIVLHKPLDAVTITTLMTAGGWSSGWRYAVNVGFSLMCPLGALLFYAGVERFGDDQYVVVGCALAFAAGVFLCISLGDLLPELEFHSHDRVKLSAAILFGIALAYGIGFLEPEHAHSAGSQHGNQSAADHQHDHSH